MYFVFNMLKLNDFNGALAILFAVVYLFLGRVIDKIFNGKEHKVNALFYLTGLAFVVLIIPLQFGRAWLSLGWLAEGVALSTYGILKNDKTFKHAGFIISGLCLAAFLNFDCLSNEHYLFAYKYLAVTIGSLTILGAFIYKKLMSDEFAKIYKYFVIANVWFFMLYSLGKLEHVLLYSYPDEVTFQIRNLIESRYLLELHYLIAAAAIVLTFLIAFALPRIKILYDLGTKIISMILYAICILAMFVLNTTSCPINRTPSSPLWISTLATFILILVGLIALLAVRDLLKLIMSERNYSIEWYSLILSGCFVLILTQNLITQYNLSFSSAAISIIYVLTTLAWTIHGFTKRYSSLRRFGLGLAILAVVKLFLIDLSSLTQGYKIVSYFALGFTLVAISFVYQYFNKRLELKEEVSVNAQEDD